MSLRKNYIPETPGILLGSGKNGAAGHGISKGPYT